MPLTRGNNSSMSSVEATLHTVLFFDHFVMYSRCIFSLIIPVHSVSVTHNLHGRYGYYLIWQFNSNSSIFQDEHASEKAQLEEKIVQLEHELEEATTNGEEMHKMLSEMLSAQKDTSSFEVCVIN